MSEVVAETEQEDEEVEVAQDEPGAADDEADEAEEAEEVEVAPEPEPEAVVDQAAMEKVFKKVETAATTYRRKVADLLGDAILGFSPCPLCSDGIMGHLPPVESIEPTSELEARLLEVLKTPSAPDYKDAPNTRRCGTCDGWGSVISGSRVAGKERLLCPTCKGNGFQGDATAAPLQPSTNGAVEFAPAVDNVPLATEDTDIWGSPKVLDDGQDNPNYGKMPQYKNPALP